MSKEEKALEIVLKIYDVLCLWDHDYRGFNPDVPSADLDLANIVDQLVTPFVEKEFPLVYDREQKIDYSQ